MIKKYPSKYSNGKEVSAAQYISELICERLAKKNKKDLHYRFWLSDEWQKEYKGQIAAANKLLSKYTCSRIVRALLTKNGLKIYSLRAPHLIGIIEQTPEPQEETYEHIPPVNRVLLNKGKSTINNKNLLDKLKEIDDGTT
jgi:hypothetical protein